MALLKRTEFGLRVLLHDQACVRLCILVSGTRVIELIDYREFYRLEYRYRTISLRILNCRREVDKNI